MNKNTKLIAAGAILIIVIAVVGYLNWPSGPPAATVEADMNRLQAAEQAAQDAQKTAPPPAKFNEPAVKPPTGRREPVR